MSKTKFQHHNAHLSQVLTRVLWEWRLALSPFWLFPPAVLIGACWLINQQGLSATAARWQIRMVCEIVYPLAVMVLAQDVLPRDVQRRTIALLAVRVRLWALVLWRMTAVGVLVAVTLGGTVTYAAQHWPTAEANGWLVWATLPPTVCLFALALLAMLGFASLTTSWISITAWWGANVFAHVFLASIALSTTHWLPGLLLFGATFPPDEPSALSWETGKWASLVLGGVALGGALALTRSVARLMRDPAE